MLKHKRVSRFNPRESVVEEVTVPKLNRNKEIVAVDFDGTIVHNKYPFIENPDMGLINFIKRNRSEYIWILWTCRTGKQLQYAVDWLKDQGIVFDLVNENVPWHIQEYGDCRKVYAHHYIDDKFITWQRLDKEYGK